MLLFFFFFQSYCEKSLHQIFRPLFIHTPFISSAHFTFVLQRVAKVGAISYFTKILPAFFSKRIPYFSRTSHFFFFKAGRKDRTGIFVAKSFLETCFVKCPKPTPDKGLKPSNFFVICLDKIGSTYYYVLQK